MTDETETSEAETSETQAPESEAPAGESVDVESDAESDEDESEDDDEKDEKDKKDKPKKIAVEFEATLPRGEAVSYFEAIVGGLRSGRLEFRQAGDALVLNPPDRLEIEVKAQQKGDKGKIVFEIEWSDRQALKISN